MPRIHTAHKFSERHRTDDVLTDELVDFKSLLLSSDVLKGLSSSGFERPSPIQLKAIPLGRCGLDLIAQAKSGTGKTCVFSVIALENLLLDSNTTQVLILAPTREIAVQIKDVIKAIGSKMDNLVCHVFIGGLPVENNKKLLKKPCHIAVGTPGRIKYLIENHFLKTESLRLFILDEADKLLEDSFQEQINWIFSSLPSNKQMMAFSATYPEYLAKHLTRYMREPTFVRLNTTDPTLQGIKQFYQLVAFHPLPHKTFQEKVSKLLKLLSTIPFNQCLVFSNFQIRAQSLCDTLCLKGWPSVFIAGNQTQSQRLKAMEKLKEFKCRVLISTDLTSRGIDAERVNLVVNMDVPRDPETYLHRIGRAGRFGTQGIAVTFAAQGEEQTLFKAMEENIGIAIDELPDPIPQSLYTSETSSGPRSGPVLPGTSKVEVDILKDTNTKASEDKVNQSKPELNTVHNSGRSSDALSPDGSKIVRLEKQRSGDDAQIKQENLGIVYNQDKRLKSQIKGNVDGDDTVAEEGVTATCIHNKELYACVSSRCDVTTKEEPFDGCINGTKELQETHSSCNDTRCPPQRNQTDDTTGMISEVSSKLRSQCDLMSSNTKIIETQSSSYEVLCAGYLSAITDEVLNKFKQDLNFDSHPKLRSSNPRCTPYFFSDASNEWIGSQNKDSLDGEVTAGLTEERCLIETVLKEKSLSIHICSSDDITKHLNGREFDAVHSTSKYSDKKYLPSVEEFERDFENYLESFSNMHHCVESSSNSSAVEDEEDEGDTESDTDVVAIEIPSDSLNQTSEGAMQAPYYNWTCNHSLHEEDSAFGSQVKNNSRSKTVTVRSPTPPQRIYAVPGNCNSIFHHELQDITFASCDHPCNQRSLYQDDGYYAGCYNNSVSAFNSYLPYGYCDECCVHNGSHNQHHYGGCDYDNYPHGTRTANMSANGQAQSFPASSQQHFGQSCADMRCYQDSQWTISWCNAYQRQNSCIRQFVAFRRSGLRF